MLYPLNLYLPTYTMSLFLIVHLVSFPNSPLPHPPSHTTPPFLLRKRGSGDIQWSPSNADTMGLSLCVQNIEVSIFQRLLVYCVLILLIATKAYSRALPCCTLQCYCCWIDQQWWTTSHEGQVSVHIIQWILYSPGTQRTEKPVRFTE